MDKCSKCQNDELAQYPWIKKEEKIPVRRFKCYFCNEVFFKKYFLVSHMTANHEGAKYNCKKCEQRHSKDTKKTFSPKK